MKLWEFIETADFGPDPKVAFVLRGGPENGPFSATFCRNATRSLAKRGKKVSAIYASSGSVPTAVMGCINDYDGLCETWENVTPEQIVGRVTTLGTMARLINRESILTSYALGDLIRRKIRLNEIFYPEALDVKFPAVDIMSNEYIIFSNRNPGHKKWFERGALGSMGLVPFLQPQFVFDPEEAGLIEKEKAALIQKTRDKKDKSKLIGEIEKRAQKEKPDAHSVMILIDGGFKGNMLLEEAMRDGFNVIFLVDIHGLKPTEIDLEMKYRWTNLTRVGFHLLSNSNDVRQYQLGTRANEEIAVRDREVAIRDRFYDFSKSLPPELKQEAASILQEHDALIERMNDGRLRLGNKQEVQMYIVSNQERSQLFNFARFKKETVRELLKAGEEADIRTAI